MSHAEEIQLPDPEKTLPGRRRPAYEIEDRHAVLSTPLKPPFPEGIEVAYFALGCYWPAEQLFWAVDGVYSTAVGYMNGSTPNPTDKEVESGMTGQAETVLVAFDPAKVSYVDLLKLFFEAHDPTQGMRQGSEVGTWNRSGIYFVDEGQKASAEGALKAYDEALHAAGHDPITTEVEPATPFFTPARTISSTCTRFPTPSIAPSSAPGSPVQLGARLSRCLSASPACSARRDPCAARRSTRTPRPPRRRAARPRRSRR